MIKGKLLEFQIFDWLCFMPRKMMFFSPKNCQIGHHLCHIGKKSSPQNKVGNHGSLNLSSKVLVPQRFVTVITCGISLHDISLHDISLNAMFLISDKTSDQLN